MRVVITGEASSVDKLRGDLSRQDGLQIEKVYQETDDSEQLLGIAEAASIVAVVKGVTELASAVKTFFMRASEKPQSLRVKTAFGAVTLELSQDITMEELESTMRPLFNAL